MPVTVVQTTNNTSVTDIPSGYSKLAISAPFASPLTPGNTVLVAFGADIISAGVNLTLGPTPTHGTVSGGSLPDRTYFFRATYVDSLGGETSGGVEQSTLVTAGNLLVVVAPPPPNGSTGIVGWNVYVGATSGGETKQNSSTLPFSPNWIEPSGGISTSGSVPGESPISDSQGNSYTRVLWLDGGLGGSQFGTAGLGFFYATGVPGGSDTITITTFGYNFNTIFGADANLMIAAFEISGFSPSIVSTHAVQQGNSTGLLQTTVTDSTAVSRITSFGSIAETAAATIDLLSSGQDEIFTSAATLSTLPLPTITGGVYTQLAMLSTTSGLNFGVWTAGPDIVVPPCPGGHQRGNIDWDEIGLDARHGDCFGILIQYSDGTHTPGNVPHFLADGTLSDSGISGGAGIGGSGITTNGPATLSANSAAVSFNDTVSVNGVIV